jgi:hypothetical protein
VTWIPLDENAFVWIGRVAILPAKRPFWRAATRWLADPSASGGAGDQKSVAADQKFNAAATAYRKLDAAWLVIRQCESQRLEWCKKFNPATGSLCRGLKLTVAKAYNKMPARLVKPFK